MSASTLRVVRLGVSADRGSRFARILLACSNQDPNLSVAFDDQVLRRFIITLEGTRDLLCVAD
jgi:hypothetical protein